MTTVREAMNPASVTVGPAHTMREAARRMTEGGTGAAVVVDPEFQAPGIVTERDLLYLVGQGRDPERELVAEHLTANVVYASPDWPLERAAEQMVKGSFRHIIVLEGSEITGILSMRDIVSSWVREAALAGGAAMF
jgi:CBS domain-containing protein